MDLSEFINKTLTSIKKGVNDANKETNNSYKIASNSLINFDIALEIAKETQTGKEGGLKIKVVEGNLSKTASNKEANISRINFTVGITTNIT